MANSEVSRLKFNDTTYEIADELARENIGTANTKINSVEAKADAYNTALSGRITNLENSAGAVLVAKVRTDMIDTNKIYVYTGTTTTVSGVTYIAGHWYFHNGSGWTDGGAYTWNLDAIDATLTLSNKGADAKVVGGRFSLVESDVSDLKSATNDEFDLILDGIGEYVTNYPSVALISGRYINSSGVVSTISNNGYKVTDYIPVGDYKTAIITGSAGTNLMICAFYDDEETYVSGVMGTDAKETDKEVEIPSGAHYIVVASDARATANCYLAKWSYDFAERYENGYVDSEVPWKAGDINGSTGAEVYNSHPVITQNYLSTSDYDYILRTDSYSEGHIYYYTYSNNSYTYDHKEQITPNVIHVLNKAYTHYRLRLFDGWSNTVDLSTAKEKFKSYQYKTFTAHPVWFGKKWVVIGDSLTEVNSTATAKYHDLISQKTGITVINLGDGGTGYKATDSGAGDSFMDRVANVPLDADVITIFGSGNDLGAENEIGNPTDTGTTTLCGCINTTIDNLYARIPVANLGVVTPTPWQQYNPATTDNKMALYSEAIVTICKNRGIPCLDLYHCSGLRPWDSTARTASYSNADGVHPNNVGQALIASKFQAFVESLLIH